MAGNGPDPNPNAKRRNARVGVVVLPPEGRDGPAPRWPLLASGDDGVAEVELELWDHLWSLPQAVEWERQSMQRVVATYCRFQAMAELGDVKASVEARQYSDRLGVTPRAMRSLMWRIGDQPLASLDAKPAARRRRKTDLRLVVNK